MKFEERVQRLNDYMYLLMQSLRTVKCDCLKDSGDLTMQELKTIEYLGINGPAIMREITDHLMVAVSTMTALIDKMVQKKLVKRERCDEDRRIVKVSLHQRGQEIYQSYLKTNLAAKIQLYKGTEYKTLCLFSFYQFIS